MATVTDGIYNGVLRYLKRQGQVNTFLLRIKKAISKIDFATLNQNVKHFHIPEILKKGG